MKTELNDIIQVTSLDIRPYTQVCIDMTLEEFEETCGGMDNWEKYKPYDRPREYGFIDNGNMAAMYHLGVAFFYSR